MKYDTKQIERYLNGDLSVADAKAFELRMTEDRDFAYEVKLHRTAIEAVQYAVLRKRTANIRREMDIAPVRPPVTRHLVLWGGLAAAATLLLIFLMRSLVPGVESTPPGTVEYAFAEVLTQINSTNTMMGSDNPAIANADSIYQLGINYVGQEKYAQAHKEFDILIADGKKRPQATFNKAHAYWKAEKNAEAKQELEKIINDKNATKNLKEQAKYIRDNLK